MALNRYKHTFHDPLYSKNVEVEEDLSVGKSLSIESVASPNKKFVLQYNDEDDSIDILYVE